MSADLKDDPNHMLGPVNQNVTWNVASEIDDEEYATSLDAHAEDWEAQVIEITLASSGLEHGWASVTTCFATGVVSGPHRIAIDMLQEKCPERFRQAVIEHELRAAVIAEPRTQAVPSAGHYKPFTTEPPSSVPPDIGSTPSSTIPHPPRQSTPLAAAMAPPTPKSTTHTSLTSPSSKASKRRRRRRREVVGVNLPRGSPRKATRRVSK
ncbi:hypothetical protein BAUCODRAFT_161056 [Baudoinia panamericana UAMH 10762]|uniref:Uncharacterized protein n=1 Tax=Baudoinia panamericana (strain UAMH 10762) TaxID=717646 RepID=M2LB29_BAUPA|nr:uncharacterized protein BAUCODRAFT_161056 [Baudoinia panamericana UAMH 10762]EMC91012.1 hypothetical protein BAUCODRAFT_161056 [Baudoinia panamericana UAMH 10762]